MRGRLDDVLEMTKINELLNRREEADMKKKETAILWALAIIGAIAAVALIAYAVYRYMTPAYEDDFDDDDDFFDDEIREEDDEKEEAPEKVEAGKD